MIYPKGNGIAKNKGVSVFLKLADWETLLSGWKVYAEYKLCIRDEFQTPGSNMQQQGEINPFSYIHMLDLFACNSSLLIF